MLLTKILQGLPDTRKDGKMKKGQFAMKKMTATFLGLSMIFVLTACGSQNSGNSTADVPSGSENDRISTETSAEILAEESAQYPTEEPIEVR